MVAIPKVRASAAVTSAIAFVPERIADIFLKGRAATSAILWATIDVLLAFSANAFSVERAADIP